MKKFKVLVIAFKQIYKNIQKYNKKNNQNLNDQQQKMNKLNLYLKQLKIFEMLKDLMQKGILIELY